MDLVIRGGTIVHAGGRQIADLGVSEGKIVQIGGQIAAKNEIDASDKYVMVGCVTPARRPLPGRWHVSDRPLQPL